MPSCFFVFLLETGFCHVGQADFELLTSSDPPTSASQKVFLNPKVRGDLSENSVENLQQKALRICYMSFPAG
ncbi:hypothetical protein AAY473_012616 [Plecturocebus cupreus]